MARRHVETFRKRSARLGVAILGLLVFIARCSTAAGAYGELEVLISSEGLRPRPSPAST